MTSEYSTDKTESHKRVMAGMSYLCDKFTEVSTQISCFITSCPMFRLKAAVYLNWRYLQLSITITSLTNNYLR